VVSEILLMPMSESAVTEDTTAQTLLTQENSFKHRSTDRRCILKESEEKAERSGFALVLRRNVLLTRS